jgi:hypothetical protein
MEYIITPIKNLRPLNPAEEEQARKQVNEYFQKKYPGMLGPELKPHEKLELAKQISPQSDVYHHSHKNPDWPPFPLPDIYDADDPHLPRDAFSAIRWLRFSNNYFDNPKSPLFAEQCKAAIEVALDIRSEFPELRIVPMAKNPDCPTKEDFINLEQWFLDAYTFEQAEIARWSAEEKPLNVSVTPPADTVTILDDFMRNHCELQSHDIESKRELIYKQSRKGKITLPATATEWRPGQRKAFFVKDLLSKWEQYRIIIPTLPPLKVQKSAPQSAFSG